MSQEVGLAGKMVGGMIRRSVRARFRKIYWSPPAEPVRQPTIFVPNHHGWFDGYLMFLALTRLQAPFLDWIAEFEAFPLFAKVGGMPFPPDQPSVRAGTIRQTIRQMNEGKRNLLMFAEGILHPPPELLPFGKALELVAGKVPDATVIPVSIRYDFSLHERPEATLLFGSAMAPGPDLSPRTRQAVEELLADRTRKTDVLFEGTLDVNERLDVRRFKRRH